MPTKPKNLDFPATLSMPGMKLANVEFKLAEDKQEKAQRLHKELVGFLFQGRWNIRLWIIVSVHDCDLLFLGPLR
jgi:hypothetical protein